MFNRGYNKIDALIWNGLIYSLCLRLSLNWQPLLVYLPLTRRAVRRKTEKVKHEETNIHNWVSTIWDDLNAGNHGSTRATIVGF